MLTLAVGGATTWWARRQGRAAPSWRWILALIAATVSSHLVMDWQGSYGLRPFLPWSDRWYYGDWVAIVDPFFWLVPLVALVWGERLHPVRLLFFATALAGCNGVVLSYAEAASWLGHEDAAVLANCLGETGENTAGIPAALKRYGRLRRSRVRRIQHAARRNGRIYHLTGPMAFARDLAIKAVWAFLAVFAFGAG